MRQKCHLNYDAQYHALRRQETRAKKLEIAIPGGWVQSDIMSIPEVDPGSQSDVE